MVCVHQDVYLADGWDRRLVRQLDEAEEKLGPMGVAGVIGAAHEGPVLPNAVAPLVGRVVDRDRVLRGPQPLPASAETLDELVLVLPRGTPLRLDPALGFHFYGADLCLQAGARAGGCRGRGALLPQPARGRSAAGIRQQRAGVREEVGRSAAGEDDVRGRGGGGLPRKIILCCRFKVP